MTKGTLHQIIFELKACAASSSGTEIAQITPSLSRPCKRRRLATSTVGCYKVDGEMKECRGEIFENALSKIQDEKEKVKTNIEQVQRTRRQFTDRVQQIRNAYLYGLQAVWEVQDLRDAPDAIMPGNFVNSEES